MGFFGREEKLPPPHPRQEPRIPLPPTVETMSQVFQGCADFFHRPFYLGGNPARQVEICYVLGMVRTERACDYLLRPLAENAALGQADLGEVYRLLLEGAVYTLTVMERTTADQVALDLAEGWVALFFPGKDTVLTFAAPTEEKRSVSPPENEPDVKGARDSFVETVRTNTSMVRRRFRAPELRIMEVRVGRQSLTPVDILYVEGITDPDLVAQVRRQVAAIDIDALLAPANLEEYLTGQSRTAFPLVDYTQRPDRFCAGLAEGRVGILADGIPLGYLAPGTVDRFFKAEQDKTDNWAMATVLTVLRYVCMLVTLFLPALYVAAVVFHPEMIPLRLMNSIIAAKSNVPFSTLTEVVVMLLAFEVLQEAGVRLPAPLGQTVSILGGLVVGTAAVEAKIVSPAVLIVVAIAGIAGYTMPSQDFAGALRIWRFFLALAAGLAGFLGLSLTAAVLVFRLARLESFAVPYLTPFASSAGVQYQGHTVLRRPLTRAKGRLAYLRPRNRRNQG